MRFAIFPLHLSKVLPMPGKSDARSYEVLHLSYRSDAPKCSQSPEISALTSQHLWWTCLLYCTCHGKSIFADPLQMSQACHRFWKCHKILMFCSLLTRCTIPCACHAKRRFNIQKWRGHVVLCAFWLRNVLRATTACTFSTSQLPKVLRTRQFFTRLTSKCASRRNGVHFFDISTSKSAPNEVFNFFTCKCASRHTRACNFLSLIWPDGSAPAASASLLFDPPEPQIIGKAQCFATFLPFRAPGSSFFGDFLRLSLFDHFSSSLLFSDSSHLCFSSVHIVGSLTSKLPSITLYPYFPCLG